MSTSETSPQSARCELYLITPPQLPDLDAFAADLGAALSAGEVAALQLRLKGPFDPATGQETPVPDDDIRRAAERLAPVWREHGVAAILNDRPDLAAELGFDGVHVGQDDAPVAKARAALRSDAFVGATCKDSRHLAMEAAEDGADYVAFGAFFPTSTKDATTPADLEIIEWCAEMLTTPCVAIGGITPANCAPLVRAGADYLAVSSAVWRHPQGPAAGVRAMLDAIETARS